MVSEEVNAGVDAATGEVSKTVRHGIRTGSGQGKTMWVDPGFNSSPAASHLIDDLLYRKAKAALAEPAAHTLVAELLASPVRRQAWGSFVENTLAFGKPQQQTMTLAMLPQQVANETGAAAVLHLSDSLLVGPKVRRHAAKGEAPDLKAYLALPETINAAKWYRDIETGNLVALNGDLAVTFNLSGKADSLYLDKLAQEKISTGRWVEVK
jgi:hypothetical protein